MPLDFLARVPGRRIGWPIRAGMREVYDHLDVWRERALRASQIIRTEFSRSHVARQAIAAITESMP